MAFDAYCQCLSTTEKRTVDDELVEVRSTCGTPVFKKRKFTMGHDAKLKSVLIRAHRAGEPIYHSSKGDESVTKSTAMEVAARYGWERFLTAKKAPAAKKATASKTAAEPTVAPGFRPVRVKVGRWAYDGQIVNYPSEGKVSVSYTTGKGEHKMATVDLDKVEQA